MTKIMKKNLSLQRELIIVFNEIPDYNSYKTSFVTQEFVNMEFKLRYGI